MQITDIKQQQKRKDRYSVYVDSKYAFSLNEIQLLDSGLAKGQEVNEEQIEEFANKSKFGKALDLVWRYLAIRPRSEWELDQYFKRKKFNEEIAAAIKTKVKKLGYLDDEQFARSWVESRRLLKPMSKRRLVQELRQKRIDPEIIDQVLSEDETDELEVLKELIQRKAKQSKYQDKQKLMAYLSRQGFSYDLIKQALGE